MKWRKKDTKSGMSIQTFKELDSGIKDAIEGKYLISERTNPEIRRLFKLAGD